MLIQKNKNIFSKILILLILLGNIFADPPLWNEDDSDGQCVLDNYPDYENNGSVTARVYPNSVEGGELGDMIAAFVNTEQRGVGCADDVPVFLGGGIAFLMMLYSNQTSGETLIFKYYDASENIIYDCNETLEFTANMTEGDVENSFLLTLNYSDVCEDELACNYNLGGSCEYADDNFDCDGNCTVETDCAGVCGGNAVEDCTGECDGDAELDGCGVCDNLPWNDCEQDCAGEWGGDAIEDCTGECNGNAVIDDCAVCDGGNADQDCAGICFGDSWNSDCGCVAVYNSGDECDDCNGTPNGNAIIDNCGICVAGNTGLDACPGYDYNLSLHVGSNLISFYALPEDRSLEYMLSSNENDYLYAILGLMNSSVNMGDNIWAGSLTSIDQSAGYWFKTVNTTTLLIEEVWDISQNIIYNLSQGTNLVSFPSSLTYPLESVITSDSENYFDVIIGESLIAIRINGEWEGSLDELFGGKGYYFILNSPLDFSYTFSDDLPRYQEKRVNEILHNQSSLQSFYFIDPLTLSDLEEGDWIVAYKDNILVASRKYHLETFLDIPVMGDDGNSYTQGYCINGDTPIFKILKKTGEYIQLNSNASKWTNLGVSFMSLDVSSEIIPYKTKINTLYPNPFNPSINLNFEIAKDDFINIFILDVNGRLVDTLYNGYIKRGSHLYTWNAHNFTSGIYFLKILTSNKIISEKITLIK